MRSKFRLELDIVLDTDAVPNVIEVARRQYEAEGAVATVDEHQGSRALSADEFIGEIEDALMELSERNPLLANANVEVERVVCKSATVPEPGLIAGAESERPETEASDEQEDPLDAETEDDLEEFETGLYLCRWPNGEFSLVKADDRKRRGCPVGRVGRRRTGLAGSRGQMHGRFPSERSRGNRAGGVWRGNRRIYLGKVLSRTG